MKYWIKSCSPLVIKKTYVDSVPQMLEWMDRVIAQTKKDFKDIKKKFPSPEELDIFSKCFVVLQVDPKKNPLIKKMLKSDPPSSRIKVKSMRQNYPTLTAEWEKMEAIPTKQRGRKKKIPVENLVSISP